jgi:hypothetical protein
MKTLRASSNTAKVLGLSLTLLARADEVIE